MDIEKIVDNFSKILVEDLNKEIYDPKKSAKDLIKAVTDLARTVKRFNEKTGTLKQIKPNAYKAACAKVKAAIEAAEADKDFNPISKKPQWNMLKKEVTTGNFIPQNEEDEKAALKFYADINGLIRQANNLTAIGGLKEPEDLVRDLGDGNPDKMKFYKGIPTRAFKRAISGPANSRVATDEELKKIEQSKKWNMDDLKLKNLEKSKDAQAKALEQREKDLRNGKIKNEPAEQKQTTDKLIGKDDRKAKHSRQIAISNHEAKAKLKNFKDNPIDGHDTFVSYMRALREKEEPNGQIKVIATEASGIGTGAGKPVIEINGQLYTVNRKTLKQRTGGGQGFMCKPTDDWDNPYYGYFTDSRKDPNYNVLRQKIKNAMLEEAVIGLLNSLID